MTTARAMMLASVMLSVAALAAGTAVAQTASAAPEVSAAKQTKEKTAETENARPAAQSDERAPPSPRQGKAMDRLELESTAITGNRELPKVLYIVPWKKSDLGDLAGRPANSLLDEVLAPVDRDVFRRQTEYYTRLNAQPAAGDPAAASPAGTPATDK